MPHLRSDRIPPGEGKAERERRIFSAFADDAEQYFGFAVLPSTIASREPPEPDILCQVAGHGPVAFELVEILEQDAAELTSKMEDIREKLLAHQGSLTPMEIERFRRKFAGSRVVIGFRYHKPLRHLQAAVPGIYSWLIHTQDGGCPREAMVPEGLRGAVEFVFLQPSSHAEVDVYFALSLGDTPLAAISRKLLGQQYDTTAPVELLAYTHDQPWISVESWIAAAKATLTPLVDDAIKRGHIRRIWIYNIAERRTNTAIKLVYPAYA